jgi:putative restriction endonuclease
MAKVFLDDRRVDIPPWVVDLRTFRRWVNSDKFPEDGRVEFIAGEVWADMSRQQAFSHVRVKDVVNRVVGGFVAKNGLGEYFGDGLRITNESAGVSNVPDGSFISIESFRAKRVHWVNDLYTELDGAPDLVIEIVSDSSEDKDSEWLMTAYWDAGIREYWVIDARSAPLRFDIHKRGAKGFTAIRKSDGWSKSAVLGRSFRLRAIKNALGHPDFSLEMR